MQSESMGFISTSGIAEQERIFQWTKYITNYVGKMPLQYKCSETVLSQPLGGGVFNGELENGSLGCLQLSRLKASPHRFRRKQSAITPAVFSPLMLIVQLEGVSTLKGLNSKEYLEPGSTLIFDTRNPFDISNEEAYEQIVVVIPRNSLAVPSDSINTYGHMFKSNQGLTKLLFGMLSESVSNYGGLNAASKISIGQSVLHLLPNMLGLVTDDYYSNNDSVGISLLSIKTYIEKNLDDSMLSIENIAEANNCSIRTIHRIFKNTTMGSVSNYIWNRRLTSAASMLIDPGCINRSITEIAFSWGFSSSAHFSRCFKASYGVTPRGYRSAASLMKQKI